MKEAGFSIKEPRENAGQNKTASARSSYRTVVSK